MPLPPVDLDQAQPARAERLEAVGGAQLGDVDAGERGRPHDRRARGHADRLAVDLERRRSAAPAVAGVPRSGSLSRLMSRPPSTWRACGRRGRVGTLRRWVAPGERSPRGSAAGRCAPASASARPSRTASPRSSARRGRRAARGSRRGRSSGDDPVDHLDAAHRADPARRALAARLLGAELHREPRLPGHVDGVVEHHDRRRGRPSRRPRRTPRSPSAGRTARPAGRRRAGRRPAPPAPAGRTRVPPP